MGAKRKPVAVANGNEEIAPREMLIYTRAMLQGMQKLTEQHQMLSHLLALAVSEADHLIQRHSQENNSSALPDSSLG
jgi:hypothetical protein